MTAAPASLTARLSQARSRLGPGMLPVAVGILLQGASQYVFLAVVARALGPLLDAVFAAFWSLLSVVGPGLMAPLEQVTGRAIAARLARHLGSRSLVLRAAAMTGLLTVAVVVLCGALAPWLIGRGFHGNAILLPVFMLGVAAFGLHFLARGILAGHGRFVAYGTLLTFDGLFRVALCLAFLLAGLRSPAAYGLAIVLGSALAASIFCGIAPRHWVASQPAAWSELSSPLRLSYLLGGSLVLQFLVSVGAFAVQVLANAQQQTAAARFLSSRVIAFIPLFLFLAVVAPLLPRLSALAALRDGPGFSRVLRQHVVLAFAMGGVTIAGAAVLGPLGSRILFGSGFELAPLDFALLGAASAGLMLGQVLAAALIALRHFGRAAVVWLIGAVAFFVVIAAVPSLFLRVELALVAGAAVACLAMALMVRRSALEASPA